LKQFFFSMLILVLDRVQLYLPSCQSISISIISFVNDSLFISQDKSLVVSNPHLFCNYHIIFSLLEQFGLVIKYRKIEVFYFSRSHKVFNSSLLNLTTLGDSIIYPKETWCYLEFIFNKKLTFQQHINFYTNKVISTVKYMKMLGNSLSSHSKTPLVQNLYSSNHTLWLSAIVL